MSEKAKPATAEEILVAAIEILQKQLPGGGLTDRQVVEELWGLLDREPANTIYWAAKQRSPS